MTTLQGAWRNLIVAALVGAAAGFGQAPYDLPVVLFAAFAVAFWLAGRPQTIRSAALLGWAFGTGYFLHSLHWIVSPFLVDVPRHGWMAPFALVFMAAGLALFWGAAFAGARYLSRGTIWPLALCLAAAEMIRAYIFTGFPWATPAQALVDVAAGQGLAFVGPHGANLAMLICAALAARLFRTGPARYAGVFGAGAAAALLLMPPFAPTAQMTEHSLRLIQPNAPQKDKWDPDKAYTFYYRQLELTAAPPHASGQAPDLIIWPETAIPWALPYGQEALAPIAEAAGEAAVTLGVQRTRDLRFFNSMVVLDPQGAVTQTYDKHHLVPFGEYLPLRKWNPIPKITAGLVDFSAGDGVKTIQIGHLPTFSPLICYEIIFPNQVIDEKNRPQWLLNLTNDGWYGDSPGPYQHLISAQMRSIEEGLPLVRVANTGITTITDAYGRMQSKIPYGIQGFIDVMLPKPLSEIPLASQLKSIVWAVLLLTFFLIGQALINRTTKT